MHSPGNSNISPDVLAYFANRQGSFGAMNLLPNHLPSEARICDLVKSNMTLDYAIGTAYGITEYHQFVRDFATTSLSNWPKLGLAASEKELYWQHLQHLEVQPSDKLAEAVQQAATCSVSAINIFSPRQCNLSCRSCYTEAIPVHKQPFTTEQIESYFAGFRRIAQEAKALGATTIYTSGDGEPTIFPRFFDLLEVVQELGMQWLFFTAGLSLSSEGSAEQTWRYSEPHLSPHTRRRLQQRIDRNRRTGNPKPIVAAFLAELAQYRDSLQIYHSVWSIDASINTEWRRPSSYDYDYVGVQVRGTHFNLPSSVLDLISDVFPDTPERFGIEMPVSQISSNQVVDLATFIVEKGIRSYIEPIVVTGRNRTVSLQPPSLNDLASLQVFMSRANCSFRNIHQPTAKVLPSDSGYAFFLSPGMGIGVRELAAANVLSACVFNDDTELFSLLHAPLLAHTNFSYVTGCKCDFFSQQALCDGGRLWEIWQQITSLLPACDLSLARLVLRLRELRPGTERIPLVKSRFPVLPGVPSNAPKHCEAADCESTKSCNIQDAPGIHCQRDKSWVE